MLRGLAGETDMMLKGGVRLATVACDLIPLRSFLAIEHLHQKSRVYQSNLLIGPVGTRLGFPIKPE